MKLTHQKEQILNLLVNDLKDIQRITAIVLGGSYATGHATEISDLDIGIYYHEKYPFDTEEIKKIAKKYALDNTPIVTDFYQWGPWVNGGAWMNTSAGKVDFLYRNIEQVTATIQKSKKGEWENHYEQQPPYGFSSVIYLAECQSCIPLYDPENIISQLKKQVSDYPSELKHTIINDSLWSAEFTLIQADTYSKKHDIFNVAGCLTRAVKNIVSALFAINELYPIGDKKAIEILERSDKKPDQLKTIIEDILCINRQSPIENVIIMKQLFEQTVSLSEGIYHPLYKL
jgi:predicted nucleotidyltransferase